jgi:SpoVK/Ycf46/Vps4 family AAA+-type ATPase
MMSSSAAAAPAEAGKLETAAAHSIFQRAQECATQVASNSVVLFFDDLQDALSLSSSSGQSSALQQGTDHKEVAAAVAAAVGGDGGEARRPMMRSILAELFLPLCRRAQDNRKSTDPYLLIVAAANCRAEYCDPAIEDCFGAHLHLELPYESDRKKMLTHYLSEIDHTIAESELLSLVEWTDGWSSLDLKNLTRDAATVNERQTQLQAGCQHRSDAKVQPSFRATHTVCIADFEDAIVARSW